MRGAGGFARTWAFHEGALGDAVMIWPWLRAVGRGEGGVVLVGPAERGAVARRWAGVPGLVIVDGQGQASSRLWRGPEAVADGDRVEGVERVVTFVADGDDAPARAWRGAAQRRFPGARVIGVGPPGSETRRALWEVDGVAGLGRVESRRLGEGAHGAVVLHVGAGGETKRWPVERWRELAGALRASGRPARVIGGPVEAQRMSASERSVFGAMQGRTVEALEELAAELAGARVVVGNDSGPAHLAAQLGVPTVAIFGPTDPAVWSPVGPRVEVARAAEDDGARRVAGVSVKDVLEAVGRAMST